MKISVIGTGYVGLIQSVGLAKLGFKINALDISEEKIELLRQGIPPIFEEGLEDLLKETHENIFYSTDLANVAGSDFVFICVGTPQDQEGKTDLTYIKGSVSTISKYLVGTEIIVLKSTVPVGTNKMVSDLLDGKNVVCSNPEFLREGMAVSDFFNPERIVIGLKDTNDKNTIDKIMLLYSKLLTSNGNLIITNWESAEIIKYASNSFLATKLSFMNEIAKLCDKSGANINDVSKGMGLDSRIGSKFLRAGIGYGGSCFPKDVRSLIWQFTDNEIDCKIISATDEVNENQNQYFFDIINEYFGDLHFKKIGLFGVAFKPGTDDLRESKGIVISDMLMNNGVYLNVFDYNIMARSNYSNRIKGVSGTRFDKPVFIKDNFEEFVQDIDGLIITLEDELLIQENWNKIFRLMKGKIILDGKNILDKTEIEKIGFIYKGIGV